ncbi:MAG: ribosome biogenesis GTPase YlqF [Firmicutes bacterium]|nr:ribosome biogenesis GTPase YlqF [Bacillota bacterium]
MEIQWYPGQMAKAKRLLQENLKLVDAVIEVLDARIPASSRNPDIRQLLRQRPVVAVLTRSDLAEPKLTAAWITALQKKYFAATAVDAQRGRGIKRLLGYLKTIPRKKKFGPRPLRLMVVGIPNVGKSSLINRLTGRSAAQTGDRPGITKGKQWVRLPGNLELLDTPGLLWPKIENKQQAFYLAAVGTIKDEIIDLVELGHKLVSFLLEKEPGLLYGRYKLPQNLNPQEVLREIGRKRGCLLKGGEVDLEAAARLLLKDFREARLGRLTLENPWEQEEEDV